MRTCMNHVQFDRTIGIDLKEPTNREECDWKKDGNENAAPDDW